MSLADDLRAAPLPAAAIAALGGGEGIWIAGGAVRDAALGRPVTDLDLAVAGDPGAVAKALGRELGEHAFELSAEFGTWRVVAPSRGWQVDVTALSAPGVAARLMPELARAPATLSLSADVKGIHGRGDGFRESARARNSRAEFDVVRNIQVIPG